jgi:hypothetical protein
MRWSPKTPDQTSSETGEGNVRNSYFPEFLELAVT